jgi:hypothetical protein
MSDELIRSLNSRITELTNENASLRAEAKDRRIKARTVTAERDELKTQLGTLTTERDTWKGKAEAAPGDKDRRIAELEGTIRTRDHKEAFHRLAKAAGVREEALADLWSLSDYKADTDTVDEARINQLIGEARTGRPYLFSTAGETPAADSRESKKPLSPPPGSGRGAPANGSGQYRLTASQMRDPKFMMDPKNSKAIAQAQADGNLVVVDG